MSSVSPATHDALIAKLQEPRLGVHEDGTEELKTWEQLFEQCQEAARALSTLPSASALPTDKITAVTRAFDYLGDNKHEPWVKVSFPTGDWDARDAFARALSKEKL